MPFLEDSPEQDSRAKFEEIEEWNEDDLLKWIHQERPGLLKDGNLEKFSNAFIRGRVFVKHGCDAGFFKNECKLPVGISYELADLAMEIVGRHTAGMVQKGKEQDTSTGKSTDHTPLLFSLQ